MSLALTGFLNTPAGEAISDPVFRQTPPGEALSDLTGTTPPSGGDTGNPQVPVSTRRAKRYYIICGKKVIE